MRTRTGYLIRRGKTYSAVWTVAGKKFTKSTGKRDKREAQAELARLMQPFLVGDEVRTLESVKARIEGAKADLLTIDEARHPPLLVANAWKEFEQSSMRPDAGERTLSQYKSEYDRFASWMAKNHKTVLAMRAVTPDIAQAYAQDLTASNCAGKTWTSPRTC